MPPRSVRTLLEGLRATNQAKDNKERLWDTYALFCDELSAIIKEIPQKTYWLVWIKRRVCGRTVLF